MTSRYSGKIKVIGANLTCFPADPVTLEPLGKFIYDPYAWTHIDKTAAAVMGSDEWAKKSLARGEATIHTKR